MSALPLMVTTDVAVLYPGELASNHAVALTITTRENSGTRGIAMMDPWPWPAREMITQPPATLDAARAPGMRALLISWSARR